MSERSRELTVILQLLYCSNHLAVKLSSGWVVGRAITWTMVVSQVSVVGSIPNRPLGALLDGEEAKGTVALT